MGDLSGPGDAEFIIPEHTITDEQLARMQQLWEETMAAAPRPMVLATAGLKPWRLGLARAPRWHWWTRKVRLAWYWLTYWETR
jgi:hypothetical protein